MPRQHKTSIPAAVLARRRARLGDPPPPEAYADYREGRLSAADRERVLEQAAVDPQVAQALLDALHFPELAPPETADPAAWDHEASWQRLRRRLVATGDLKATSRPDPEPLLRHRQAHFSRWQLAAVAVLAAGLGLASGVLWRPFEPPQPRINLPFVSLLPDASGGSRAVPAEVSLPATAEGVFVTLSLEDPRRFATYQVELRDPAQQVIWKTAGLLPQSGSVLTFTLPREFLLPGRSHLILRGIGSEPEPPFVASYTLNLGP